ncbi:MAG: ABC transporter ATP-binding protein [Candidatus Omnitrophota bacterium]|nr:ABC transporter ATP-binding protein [Candidatus Omnitrophota bacterium]
MFSSARKILSLLTIGGRKKFFWLMAATIVMAFLDMIGVASIFPFLSLISNPEAIHTNLKLKWVYDTFQFTNKDSFLITLGVFSFALLVINNVLRANIAMALLRFTWYIRYVISKDLFSKYLFEPYVFFLNRNTSELTAYLASEVARVVSSVLIPAVQVCAQFLLVLLILVLLIIVNPIIAVVVFMVIGGGYAIIYVFTKKRLSQTGKNLSRYSKEIFKALNETFGGIKEIKLSGKEAVFIEKFSIPTKKSVNCYCSQFLISQVPKYAFEVLAFGGILFIAVYIAIIKKEPQQVFPLVGLYALAAYRLFPAMQQVFSELTSIQFGYTAFENVYQDFHNRTRRKHEERIVPALALPFLNGIEFRNLAFTYPNAQKPVIENLNFIIKANTTVGLVGGSGAGKTTMVDILLGLLRPQKGELVVDDTIISDDNLFSWQANIGYVTQHIYLCDDTITRNIAFGVPDQEIDHQAVKRAAKLANIDDFVVNELPYGYDTEIGERGVRLSGGQRQRIGIARAMYYNPSLLVFDEATSALDGITEGIILEAIHNLAHQKTIIIIAHRFSTVKECDVIYMLERGKIVGQGTYAQLLDDNEQFRQMAKVTLRKND